MQSVKEKTAFQRHSISEYFIGGFCILFEILWGGLKKHGPSFLTLEIPMKTILETPCKCRIETYNIQLNEDAPLGSIFESSLFLFVPLQNRRIRLSVWSSVYNFSLNWLCCCCCCCCWTLDFSRIASYKITRLSVQLSVRLSVRH